MTNHVARFTIPAAFEVLPLKMRSPEATAMLIAIGLQESKFLHRRQMANGAARGFWQFEKNGINGVMQHEASKHELVAALQELRYGHLVTKRQHLYYLVEHNDTVACVFARLLLWTLPAALPREDEVSKGYSQYLDAWRPGKPHELDWPQNFKDGWAVAQMFHERTT